MKFGRSLTQRFNLSPDWDQSAGFESAADAAAAIGEHGFIARSADQEKDFLKNATAQAVGEAIKGNDKKFLDAWDAKLNELTGQTREPNTKTEDYIFGTLKQYKESSAKAAKDFEELKANGMTAAEANTELQKQFDAFKQVSAQEKSDLQGKIEGFQTAQFQTGVNAQITEALGKIRPILIQGGTDTEKLMIENTVENLVNKFKTEFKPVEYNGTIIYHNQDGSPVIDPTDGNHLSTFTLLQKGLESIIDTDRQQAGAGGAGAGGGQAGSGADAITLPEGVKTQMGVYDWILSDYKTKEGNKVEAGSKLFNQLFEKLAEGLPRR